MYHSYFFHLCSSTVLALTRETFPFLPWNNSALTLAPQGLTFYPKLIFKEFLPPWMVPFLKRLPVNTVFSTLLHMYLDYLAPFSPLCCGRQFFSLEIYQIKWACGSFWWLLLRSMVWISSSLHNPLWHVYLACSSWRECCSHLVLLNTQVVNKNM